MLSVAITRALRRTPRLMGTFLIFLAIATLAYFSAHKRFDLGLHWHIADTTVYLKERSLSSSQLEQAPLPLIESSGVLVKHRGKAGKTAKAYKMKVSDTQYGFEEPAERGANWHATEEVRNVAFLKVHKTGSSTVQNIFLRFGDTRKLTFVLSSRKGNECGGHYHCISFMRTLHEGNILPCPKNKTFEMLCSHVVYDRDAFRHYLPPQTKYVSLLRDPTTRLQSAFAFFEMQKFIGGNLSTFARDPLQFDHGMLNNRMAFEFGFNQEWFPLSTHPQLIGRESVEVVEYVEQIMDDFTLIMINEKINESLVLLKRMFHWQMADILYHKKLVRGHPNCTMLDKLILKDYLYLDYFLYERAVEELDRKIENEGPEFHLEVKAFETLNTVVNNICRRSTVDNEMRKVSLPPTRWYGKIKITQAFCEKLLKYETPYFREIRERQYGPYA